LSGQILICYQGILPIFKGFDVHESIFSEIRVGSPPYIPPRPLKAPNILTLLSLFSDGCICKDGLSTIRCLIFRPYSIFRDFFRSTHHPSLRGNCATTLTFKTLFLVPFQRSSFSWAYYPFLPCT